MFKKLINIFLKWNVIMIIMSPHYHFHSIILKFSNLEKHLKQHSINKFINCISILLFFIANLLVLPGSQNVAHAFSVGEEKEFGEKLLSLVRKEFRLIDDPDINQYINNLGNEILAVTGPSYFDYYFFVINNKEFNAFAAPSGLIFFHSGLIEAMETEDELVSVLAHEIGHVQSRHIAERMNKASKVSLGTLALILAGVAVGNGAVSEALITGSMATAQSMNLSFSRKDEEESDRLAYKWMQENNRDPKSMVTMLNKMYRVSRLQRDMVPPYLLTHPEPHQRLNYVQDLLLMNGKRSYAAADNFVFQRFKTRILSQTKNTADLLTLYKKRIDRSDQSEHEKTMNQYGLALAYSDSADLKNAILTMEKVIAAYPSQAILLTDMGVLHFQDNNYQQALHYFQKAREMAPHDAYTTFYIARTYEQLKNENTALSYYEELLPVLPHYSRLYQRIGQIKAATGKKGEGYYYISMQYWLDGEPEKALFHLKQSMDQLAPGSHYYKLAGQLQEKIKRLSQK